MRSGRYTKLERAGQVTLDREKEWIAMATRNARVLYEDALLKPGRRSMGRVGTVQESNLIEPPRVAGGPGRVAWLGAALDLMLLEGAAPRRRSGSPAGHSGRR